MTPTLRTGVVVLNWNGLEHLRRCLSSLLASDHPDFFVVVVDNASVDGSVEWLQGEHPGVQLLVLDENRRFAGGNNAGAALALDLGAELLLLLNNDATVAPDTLSRLVEAFEEDPELGLAGPRICYADAPQRIWYGGGRWNMATGAVGHRAIREAADAGRDPSGRTDWVSGCALAVRADWWKRLGGLDESFYIYAEDLDFCRRAHDAGCRIHYANRATVYHAVSASVGGTASPFKAYHKARSSLRFFARHASPWHGPLLWPALMLRHLADAGYILLKGHPSTAWAVAQAWVDAMRGRVGHPVSQLRRPAFDDPSET